MEQIKVATKSGEGGVPAYENIVIDKVIAKIGLVLARAPLKPTR
jgi:hypothetical protein